MNHQLTDFDITWRMMENRRVDCTWRGLWSRTEKLRWVYFMVLAWEFTEHKERLN